MPEVSIVRSRQRVADHGEVFTPAGVVEDMVDLVKHESERFDSRFLEPACGSGNFLVEVLHRKLAAVDARYGRSGFERRNYSVFALMCIYGIELLMDNVDECRSNLLAILSEFLGVDETAASQRAASYVLSQNIVHGNALTMLDHSGLPITFAEWGYLGKGKFQRRDFRYDILRRTSSFDAEDPTADRGKHEIFIPIESYPPMTLEDLAA